VIAAAVACFGVASAFFMLAADAPRWRSALDAGDVRYRAAPAERGLWEPAERVPFGLASAVLGVDDDVALRRAVRAFRLGRLDAPFVTDPRRALQRAEAQDRAVGGCEPPRDPRPRALGLGIQRA
jgi:hypothetical protein